MNAESFDNSKKYLRLLQVFRIMGQWIVQNMRALETLREDFFREITGVGYDEAEVDLMKKNWAIVMEDAQHRTAVVQESIRMRAEEIKELQDGVCCDTSPTSPSSYFFVWVEGKYKRKREKADGSSCSTRLRYEKPARVCSSIRPYTSLQS